MIPVVSEPYQAAPGRSGSIRLKDRRQREQNGALQTARSVNHFVNQVTLALMKYLAGGVALLVAVSIELWILSRGMDEPASVFQNGVLTEVVNCDDQDTIDRKSTRLNSSHVAISYAVFCLKK